MAIEKFLYDNKIYNCTFGPYSLILATMSYKDNSPVSFFF